MNKLFFGTAGIPISTPKGGVLEGIKQVKRLGLGGMELEFVRRVNITEEKALEVKKAAEKYDVKLTCHGQYYINLNSEELKKIGESQTRIYNAARIAWLCGAKSLTFHAGFYMKNNGEEAYKQIKEKIEEVREKLDEEGNKIKLSPETTGKLSQWGTVEEILRLSQEVEGVGICLDFSHLFARSLGETNSYEKFCGVLSLVEKNLGRGGLEEMHIHVSGIEYGQRGEKWHLNLAQSEFKYKELLRALKEFRCGGVVISESPSIEGDALRMKNEYSGI